jgi:hypothetical protein
MTGKSLFESIEHDCDRIDHCDVTIYRTYTISIPIKCFESIVLYSYKQNNATCYRCCYQSWLSLVNIFSVDVTAIVVGTYVTANIIYY